MNNLKPCPICYLDHQVHNTEGTVHGKTMFMFIFLFFLHGSKKASFKCVAL